MVRTARARVTATLTRFARTRYAVLDGTIQIIGSSLLGLTLQCARCHDHKFEPVTQKEYYQLHAILAPAFRFDKWIKPNDRIIEAAPRSIVERWQAHERSIDAEIASLTKQLGPGPKDSPAEKAAKQKSLGKMIKAANARRQPHPGRIAWVADLGPEPVTALSAHSGQPEHSGTPARPGSAWVSHRCRQSLRGSTTSAGSTLDGPAAGPGAVVDQARLAPCGASGPGAGQPHLAASFRHGAGRDIRQSGIYWLAAVAPRRSWNSWLPSWSARAGGARALHRQILNSAVWRQSSEPRPQAQAIDPDNRLLARFPLRRLDAEAVPRRHAHGFRRA